MSARSRSGLSASAARRVTSRIDVTTPATPGRSRRSTPITSHRRMSPLLVTTRNSTGIPGPDSESRDERHWSA